MMLAIARPAPATAPVATVAREVEAIRLQLAAPRQDIEGAFIEVGGHIVECAEALARISATFSSLPRDLESEEMVEASNRLADVGQKTQVMVDTLAAERGDIDRLMTMVTAVGRPTQELQKAVRIIGLVAVNARIVAAGLASQKEDFSVFTTDIAQLSESAAKTVGEFSVAYEKLLAALKAADAERASFEASHQHSLRLLISRLDDHLAAVSTHRERAAAASADIGNLSREIAMGVGTVVSALQIGDITRQRVEHVEEALALLAEFLTAPPEGQAGGSIDESEALATAGAVCRLQSAQMDQSTAAFDREVLQVVESLRKLGSDACDVVRRSQGIYGGKEDQGGSALAVLSSELRDACIMLRVYADARVRFDHVTTELAETITVLFRHVQSVQEIEANMRLVSLNTAVKCARLGPEGMTLNVIANELRLLTGQTVIAAEAVMSGLKEAASLAERLHNGVAGDAALRARSLEAEAHASLALLETVDGRLTAALAELAQDGAFAVKMLGRAASGITIHDDIGGALRSAQVRIEVLAGQGRGTDFGATVENAAIIKERAREVLQGRYTMESERLLHERVLGETADSRRQAASPAPAAREPELDDILF